MATKVAKERQKKRVASAKKRAEAHESGFNPTAFKIPDGMSLFRFKQAGRYKVDLLPYTVGKGNKHADPGELFYERTFYTHPRIGPDNDSYCCLRRTFKKPCPVCEYQDKLKLEGVDEKVVSSFSPKERQLFLIVNRDPKEVGKGPQLLEMAYFNFGKQLDDKILLADEEENYATFHDPDEGKRLNLGVKEDSFSGQAFFKVADIEFRDRPPLEPELLKDLPCLDDLLIELPYDKLKGILLQSVKGKVKKDDDDEDDDIGDEDEDEVDDVDDEADVEEDEDEDEDEDDEDDTPKKKPAAKKKAEADSTASDLSLKVGDMVAYAEEDCEIVKISGDGTSLTLEEDATGKIYRGVAPSEVKPIVKDEDEDLEDIEDEDDEEPVNKKKAKTSGKKPAKDDDEDEEDLEDIEDEDEDEDEEEDLEDVEEDEDDDEPPVKKKPAKKRK